ncbi:MAG: two-component system, sensor histidine kinase RpfC [Burkholderiales bacterium]
MSDSDAEKMNDEISASLLAQAKLRVTAGLPVILLMSAALWYWGSPHGGVGVAGGLFVLLMHAVYAFAALMFARRMKPFSVSQMVVGTAILDPLLLSVFVGFLGENGSIFVCFFLFTTLGFGFRIGIKPMWICQAVSVVGFAAATALTPAWTEHPIPALTVLLLLLIVPLYATLLIKKLRDARALAESESKAKSELLAKVSHELRTPLAGIVASAELIAAETGDPATEKRVETILSLSRDLTTEINDLLDTAKYKADALVLESAPFDVRDVVEKVRLTLASAAASKGIGLQFKMDEAIEGRIVGDAHYLGRVLLNIVGNAVKFTSQGGVDVSLKLLDSAPDQYRVRFAVQDTGIGIDTELHRAIFDPFFQASVGTTRKYGGTGLGMSIAKELVVMMGGELLLESETDKGSLFYFELKFPRVVSRLQEKAEGSAPRVVTGKRILIADDNATNLLLVRQMLELDRHEVVTAANGTEAVAVLASRNFDLVILDFNMADMDGADVMKVYRFGRINAAPVFFLTADVTLNTVEKLHAMGAIGVLHKPITLDGLREAVVKVFAAEARPLPVRPLQRSLAPVAATYIDHDVIAELQSVFPRQAGMVQLLESAITDTQKNYDAIVEAIESGNVVSLRERAHALKGVTDSVGAVRLSAVANRLMKVARDDLARDRVRFQADIREATMQSVGELRLVISEKSAAR